MSQVHTGNHFQNDSSLLPCPKKYKQETKYRDFMDFQKFFENLPLPMVVLDPDGILLYCNNAEAELLEFENSDSLYGRKCSDFFVDMLCFEEFMLVTKNSAESIQRFPAKFKTEKGNIVDVLLTSNAEFDEFGNVSYIRCVTDPVNIALPYNHDTLDKVINEVNIKQQNTKVHPLLQEKRNGIYEIEKLSQFLENCSVPVHIVAGDGQVLWANPEELNSLGYDQSEYFNHHISEFHCDEPVINDILFRLSNKQTLRNFPARLKKKDGSVCEVLINSNVFWDKKGNFVHTRCFTRDVTKLNVLGKARNEAEIALKKAEQENEAKSQFLAMLSHEVRTPMSGILGMATSLLDSELNEIQRDDIKTIITCCRTLTSIISELLDGAKCTKGQMNVELLQFTLHDPISQMKKIFDSKAKEKNLNFSIEYVTDSPDFLSEFPVCVMGDPMRLQQVLFNLTSNSLKFTDKGHIKWYVSCFNPHSETFKILDSTLLDSEKHLQNETIQKLINCEAENRIWVRYTIEDTGCGIPLEAQGNLFQAFVQADNSISRFYGGTGLGLFICKELVKLMGGSKIDLVSTEGKGTRLSFCLPFGKTSAFFPNDAVQSPTTMASLNRNSETEKSFKKRKKGPKKFLERLRKEKKLLMAEDNLVNQKVAQKMLFSAGYTDLTIVNNGMELLELLEKDSENEFDCLFLDMFMPRLDGVEAFKRIRLLEKNVNANIPVFALTADATAQRKEKCLNLGMLNVVTKPFSPTDLINILDN